MKKVVNRMCFVCRKIHSKEEMTRLVKTSSGDILLDKTGKMNGRGAYICHSKECIEQMKKQRVLNKAFKCEFPASVYTKLCEELIDN